MAIDWSFGFRVSRKCAIKTFYTSETKSVYLYVESDDSQALKIP